ncbi:DUF6233 domain-containing protein [Streptomyces sp. Ju416(a)]
MASSANSAAFIDREAALAALREPDIESCPVCAPETGRPQHPHGP